MFPQDLESQLNSKLVMLAEVEASSPHLLETVLVPRLGLGGTDAESNFALLRVGCKPSGGDAENGVDGAVGSSDAENTVFEFCVGSSLAEIRIGSRIEDDGAEVIRVVESSAASPKIRCVAWEGEALRWCLCE
jgi:hypothetical protein